MDANEARQALAGVQSAEAQLAERIGECPAWRHAAFGGVMALFVGSAGIGLAFQMAGLALGLMGVVLILQWDRKHYGVFVNGYRKGATRPLTFVLLGAILALLFGAIYAREAGLSPWTIAGLAAIAFALATWASVAWQRVYLRELRRGRQ